MQCHLHDVGWKLEEEETDVTREAYRTTKSPPRGVSTMSQRLKAELALHDRLED